MNKRLVTDTKLLTPQKVRILRLVQAYLSNRHYSPSIQELAEELKKSRATVFEHCVALQKSGFLSTCPGKARSLKLTPQAEKILAQQAGEAMSPKTEYNEGIPLLGKVAAGVPVEAVEDKGSISFAKAFGKSEATFALEVSGLSMIEEGIYPGDYVICKRSNQASNGELVVALVDGTETTLKRFYKEKKHIRLQPANRDYEPILTKDCQIEAIVIGLIRKIKN